MEKAMYVGLGMQEESITDLVLSNIQHNNQNNFYTRKFSHREEGNYSGADWIWCIGEPGSWITFAIQAKIVNLKTNRVHYLHYQEGKQYHRLINFSREFNLIPKYSIYTIADNTFHLFSKGLPKLSSFPTESWAFTAISPKYIYQLKTKMERHVSSVLQLSLPWEYIFSPGNETNLPLGNQIARNLEDVYWSLENEFRRQHDQPSRNSYKKKTWDNPQPSKMVSSNIPDAILYLMTENKFPYKLPVANVSVLTTVPIQNLLGEELREKESTRHWKLYPDVFERKITKLQENSHTYYLPNGG